MNKRLLVKRTFGCVCAAAILGVAPPQPSNNRRGKRRIEDAKRP